MKTIQRVKYSFAALLFLSATTALSFANVQFASAATMSWTGAGDGTDFSDTANWGSGAVPQDGDVLTFNVAGLSAQKVLNNDITGLSLAGITFTGNADTYYSYTLQGNPITLTGNIQNTTTGVNSDYSIPVVQANLTLGANSTVSKVNIGVDGATLNLGSHNLTFAGAASCGASIRSIVTGTGAINLTGSNISLSGASPAFAGDINVTGKATISALAVGTTAGDTTVSGSGELGVVHVSQVSSNEPFILGGTGSFSSTQNYYGCSGGSSPVTTLTLTGGVTLTSNFVYKGTNNLVISEPFTTNGHTFTVGSGVTGTLTTPQGESTAPVETIQLDGDSNTTVNVNNKQTAVLNGKRNGINVGQGGILKGTGTATYVQISDGGLIAPGNSPGTITVLEDISISGTYEAEVLNATTYDKIVVGQDNDGSYDPVNIYQGAALNVVLSAGWTVKQGDKFTIIDNLSTEAVSGTFDGLAEGAQLTVNGVTFSISYVGGTGNDVVLTALNTGNDPSAPNTGAMQVIRKNPLVVVGLGALTAVVLIGIAIRRRQTNN